MQFSVGQRRLEKKLDSSNPSYQSMDCVIKWRNRFINSIRFFFHLSQNVYHATEQTAEMS